MFLHCDLWDHTATVSISFATRAPCRDFCTSNLSFLLHCVRTIYIYIQCLTERALVETLSLTLRLFLCHLAVPSPTRIACSVPVLGLPVLEQGDFNFVKDEQRTQRGVRDLEDQIALAANSKSKVCYEIGWFCNYIIERMFVG